jgi:hypothetical protein
MVTFPTDGDHPGDEALQTVSKGRVWFIKESRGLTNVRP